MVSYFKTQWFRFLIGLICLGVAIYYAFSPAGDTTTLEGVYHDVRMSFNFVMYLSLSLIWFITSFIDFRNLKLNITTYLHCVFHYTFH